LTSHSGILDHSFQGGDETDGVLHPHILDLKAVTDACSGFDLEVDFTQTVNSGNNFDAQYDTVVVDDEVWVTGVPKTDLAGKPKVIVSFLITPVFDGEDHLCLDLKDSAIP